MKTGSRSCRPRKKAVILLSGGLDSATVLYEARKRGYDCRCLLFDYGQRHAKELSRAKAIARRAGCPAGIVRIALPRGGSTLLDRKRANPSGTPSPFRKELPATYVPGRNTIFISYALSYAETIGATTVFIGANALDFSGYPDCRPAYYRAWNGLLASLGTKIRIEVPLLHMTKAGIIRRGIRLGVPYELTWSCYAGDRRPCGVCDSCLIRARGFAAAGRRDPALQRKKGRS